MRRSIPKMPQRLAKHIGVTALYTSQAAIWAGLPRAELFDAKGPRRVFRVTNFVYGLARRMRPGMISMRHSIVHRCCMIDHLVRAEDAGQVLELASGLSSRGARLSEDPEVCYTEIDLQPVIELKQGLLQQTEAGRRIASRPNYRLMSADVTGMEFGSVLRPSDAAVVVAEGLHVYLEAEAQRRLWSKVAAALGRCPRGCFVFDPNPTADRRPPRLRGRILRKSIRRFTGGS